LGGCVFKLEGQHTIAAGRERVYQALVDAGVLQRSIPGCQRLEKTGENSYSATLTAGVGAIKGAFSGNLRLEEMTPPQRYRIRVEGMGQPGFMKASGEVNLTEQEGGTLVEYWGEIQVGGLIAAAGQRMLQATGRMMVSKFFTAIEDELRAK